MPITMQRLSVMLRRAACLWRENAKQLGILDSRFGDGDHGVSIEKIAKTIQNTTEMAELSDMKALLTALAGAVPELGIGSVAPLYAALFTGLAAPLDGTEREIDAPVLKKMFAAALAAMREVTTAGIGDKTIMDAVIPAVEAAEAADIYEDAVLAAAAAAAGRGAESTRDLVANYGRARLYAEDTLGVQDVGATSAALFFEGLSEGYLAENLASTCG